MSTLHTKNCEADRFATLIRNHWGVENALHRTLDVEFQEDDCRVREPNVAKSLAAPRRLGHSIFTRHSPKDRWISGCRRRLNRRPEHRDLLSAKFVAATTPKTITKATAKTALIPFTDQ